MSAVGMGKVSASCAPWSLRVVLCTGEGTVESAEPTEDAQLDWVYRLQRCCRNTPCTVAY